MTRSVWDHQFAALAMRHRVIRVDLRGSGESGCGIGPALMETMAGDVFGLLDTLGIERVILVGHSMGGYVALAFFRMYAERVAGLALVASHFGADSAARVRLRDAEATALTAHGTGALFDKLVVKLFAPAFAANHPGVLDSLRANAASGDPAGAAAQVIGMKERVDSADLLEDIRVPALLLGGRSDALIPERTFEENSASIADCELLLLPDVGHMPMLEAPAATTDAIERLAARCALNAPATAPQSVRAIRV